MSISPVRGTAPILYSRFRPRRFFPSEQTSLSVCGIYGAWSRKPESFRSEEIPAARFACAKKSSVTTDVPR